MTYISESVAGCWASVGPKVIRRSVSLLEPGIGPVNPLGPLMIARPLPLYRGVVGVTRDKVLARDDRSVLPGGPVHPGAGGGRRGRADRVGRRHHGVLSSLPI